MRGSELSEQPDIAVFAFEPEPMCVVGKYGGTTLLQCRILIRFYVLRNDDRPGGLHTSDFFTRERTFGSEPKIEIGFDLRVEGDNHCP